MLNSSIYDIAKLTKESLDKEQKEKEEQALINEISEKLAKELVHENGKPKTYEEIKDLDFQAIAGIRTPSTNEIYEHILQYEKLIKTKAKDANK